VRALHRHLCPNVPLELARDALVDAEDEAQLLLVGVADGDVGGAERVGLTVQVRAAKQVSSPARGEEERVSKSISPSSSAASRPVELQRQHRRAGRTRTRRRSAARGPKHL